MSLFHGKTAWAAILFMALLTSPRMVYALDLAGDGEDIVISMEEARENEEEKNLRDIYLEINYPNGLLAAPPEPEAFSTDSIPPERVTFYNPTPPEDAVKPQASGLPPEDTGTVLTR